MDPDKTLDELIELVYKLAEPRNENHADVLISEIVEKAADLRSWISKGGFGPSRKEDDGPRD